MSFLGRWARKTARFTDALKDFAPASREVVAGFAHHDDVTMRWRAWSDDQHGGKSRAALTWIPRTPRGAEHEDEDVGAMVLEGEVSTPDSSTRGSRGVALVRAEWALWVPSDAVEMPRDVAHSSERPSKCPAASLVSPHSLCAPRANAFPYRSLAARRLPELRHGQAASRGAEASRHGGPARAGEHGPEQLPAEARRVAPNARRNRVRQRRA